jgi:hypothetical protein
MSEDHVRRAENEILKFHVRKDRDGISKPASIADNGVALDVSVLAQTAIFAYYGTRCDMRKVPDLRVLPDLRTLLYDGARMDKCCRRILLQFCHK